MLLKIEQTGSSLEGEVCSDQACTPIEWGEIEELDIELVYGCDDCALPSTSLDLVLERGRLVGDAGAAFFPCQGACAAGATSSTSSAPR